MESNDIKKILIEAYNHHAQEREGYILDDWKIQERENFLSLLKHEHRKLLLEVGAGTGKDSKFFSDAGLDVTCIDLSTEMVNLCKQKGLAAYIMDMTNLEFQPHSFDAVYSFNSLLHVPKAELPSVLENIEKVLKPAGLFFLGMYGGTEFEGIWEKDSYTPKRFFSFHTDEQIQQLATQQFDLLAFKRIDFENNDLHFQSLILRKQNP
jgi:SAM-dependent methyltransferase